MRHLFYIVEILAFIIDGLEHLPTFIFGSLFFSECDFSLESSIHDFSFVIQTNQAWYNHLQ